MGERKLVVYIAGPFRGENAWEIENNIRKAEHICFRVWEAGAVGVCPHTNTRFFHDAFPNEVWLDGYLELLDRCDAILMCPGYEESDGSKAELKLAEMLGKLVFYDMGEFEKWMGRGKQ